MEQRDSVESLTVADLIQRSRPLTSALSLSPSCTSRAQQSSSAPSSPATTISPLNPNPKFLETLSQPTVLIGTLTLPSIPTTNPPPNCHCPRFSDGSTSPICCDILDFNPKILGRKIEITAWNFIPLKCGTGNGFLEIIRWALLESSAPVSPNYSNVNSFPLSSNCSIEDEDRSYFAYGALESVSPVSAVPHSVRNGNRNTKSDSKKQCGFLMNMLICDCKFCSCKYLVSAMCDLDERKSRSSSHSFVKPMIVYLRGSASAWHHLMTRLVGSVVLVSGLKKKLVYIGKEEPMLMYVTTDKGLLHLPVVPKHWVAAQKISIRGDGECGCYCGTVTASYMQGMVIELDREVMLLLTDKNLSVPHSLRVGAIISVKNVHFVNPRFPWTNVLILGACLRTTINIKLFSPLETGCHVVINSQSLLGKFIGSLDFCARLWMLLLLTSFRRKFAGILSEKDILGSRHKEGLGQKFARLYLPSSAFQHQHGVFVDFCKHDLSTCNINARNGHLKLMVPISNLLGYCMATWRKMLSDQEIGGDVTGSNNQHNSLSCPGRNYILSTKRIIVPKHASVTLLGYLKTSPSSGRLQLVDATGSIDVAVSGLPSNWHYNKMIEIKNFSITTEGPAGKWDQELLMYEPFTCQSILSTPPPLREMNMSHYLTFTYKDLQLINSECPSDVKWKGYPQVVDSGTYHLLWIMHKFPTLWMYQGNCVDTHRSSVFAEALILPWDLFLDKEYSDAHVHSSDQVNDTYQDIISPYQQIIRSENGEFHKRCKIDKPFSQDAGADWRAKGGTYGPWSSSLPTHAIQDRCESICPLQIPCKITGKSVNFHSVGVLKRREPKAKIRFCCTRVRKVLLEFNSESICLYQALRIHGYHIMKHCQEDIPCSIEDSKLLITSGMQFWRSSFSPAEISQESNSVSPSQSFHSIDGNNEDLNNWEDISIYISARFINYVKLDSQVLDGFVTPSFSLREGIQKLNCKEGRVNAFHQHSEMAYQDQPLPEGNLTSLHGLVISVHNCDQSPFAAQAGNHGDVLQLVLAREESSICIHIATGNYNVRIIGHSYKGALPAGFEIGVSVTFYRILEVSGLNEYMLIPASFIEVDSSSPLHDQFGDKNSYVSPALGSDSVTSPEVAPALLTSETLHLESKPMQLHCRVLAVYVLVLEKTGKSCQSESSVIDITLGGFVLDDGASSCCCWANHERAAALLGLHVDEFPYKACKRRASKQPKMGQACGSTIRHLHKIIEKHGRVIVKNNGSYLDSFCHDLTFSVSAERIISSSDEDVLRSLMLNACLGTVQTVVGSQMDLNTIKRLEEHIAEIHMTMLPLQNIWATEVHRTNPLAEARNIFQELVTL